MHHTKNFAWAFVIVAAMLAPAASNASRAGGDTAMVRVGRADHAADAFVAWPSGDGGVPAVIVVHEWWGLNAQIRSVALRLAQQGYVAIVPDLYNGKVTSDPEQAHVLVRGLDHDAALRKLENSVLWVRTQPRASKSKIGIVGFCMGGILAQRLALKSTDISAVVMFYGNPETDAAKLAALRAPLQGHFGADDDGIPIDRVRGLKAGLDKAGKIGDVHIYPGAGHAFMHEGRASHRPDAARQAWARMLAFFQKHLKS